jgi:hypothetical protein
MGVHIFGICGTANMGIPIRMRTVIMPTAMMMSVIPMMVKAAHEESVAICTRFAKPAAS